MAKGAFDSPSAYRYSSAAAAIGDFVATPLVLQLDAATRNATLLRDGTAQSVFTGAQRDTPAPGDQGVSYTAGANTLGFGCVPTRLGLAYTFTAAYGVNLPDPAPGATDASRLILVGGARTLSTSELSSGSYAAVVALGVLFTGTTSRQDATGGETVSNVTFDLPSGVLKGTLNAVGDRAYTLNFTATLVPGTTRFDGTVTTASGATGKLIGGFFGPGGREYGFTLAVDDGNAHYTGASYGKR
ncbi:hypothetical protein [Sphingomonas sp. R86521]|uniref:hypothetical protein n=1 Tax=Sphingomonas sp. R86521 TaxID=3093860 RepID=UPI0036D23CF9